MTFLSLLDDRVRTKGSRDPLGFESVWTSFGRRVVGNLTTVTSSWMNFAVALLGFHWCNELCREKRADQRLEAVQAHFVRYEQLAAYLRCLDERPNGYILGVTRARKNINSDGDRIYLGTRRRCLILSDQISYGLWGLYSSAMRESGLVEGDLRQLTETAREITSEIERHLTPDRYLDLIKQNDNQLTIKRLVTLKDDFLSGLQAPEVQDKLIDALLRGSRTHLLQQELHQTTGQLAPDVLEISAQAQTPEPYIEAIKSRAASSLPLRTALNDIESVERLLVSADILFGYCRRKDGSRLDDLASEIDKHLRFDFLPSEPSFEHCIHRGSLERIRQSLQTREIKDAIREILDLNRKVMELRGGAPWAEAKSDGPIRVRLKSETGELPDQAELETRWQHNYFLTSYAQIAANARTSI